MNTVKGNTQRLDKILVNLGIGSRTDVQKLIRQGRVFVNGALAKQAAAQIEAEGLNIQIEGQTFVYRKFSYYMLNKPAGLISASRGEEIVVDLIDLKDRRPGLFPIGRLDRDTEGLLLISNDGQLAHRLLAPKRHVPKRYFVRVEGELDMVAVEAFREGIVLEDGELCRPAQLILAVAEAPSSEVEVVLFEGKFHQIKRMMQAVGCKVVYLKRIAFGSLLLDNALMPGEYRALRSEEIEALRRMTE